MTMDIMTKHMNAPMDINDDRADAVENAVYLFSQAVGNSSEDMETQITDLVIDLFHFCEASGISVDSIVAKSMFHFKAELTQKS